ncbi:T9SS type A sorting domain-containing protein [bacterium]|nr:T9SS type A sorting domain-containing protein [bacterium]
MRRSSLAFVTLFAIGFAAPGLGREPGPQERIFFTSEPPPVESAPADLRADTLFLFAASGPGAYGTPGTNARGFSFDDGAGGPAAAGWTPVDVTAQTDTYWHLQDLYLSHGHGTDFAAADDFADGGPTAGNDYAWWCGRSGACGWAHPIGYGDGWNQWLVLAVPEAATGGTLEFDYVADFEGDVYDYFTLYAQSAEGELSELLDNHVSGEQDVRHYGPLAFGEVAALIFAFVSDGAWSDEDGSYVSDVGAVWLDNFELDYTGAPDVAWDFESGVESDFPALTASWPAGAGAYGALYRSLFSEDQCIVNSSYAWAFFDLGTTNPEYPIPVIPYGPPYVDNGIVSPVLDRAHSLGDPVGEPMDDVWHGPSHLLVRCMTYFDLPLEALIFCEVEVQAAVSEFPCLGEWEYGGGVYYGGGVVAWLSWTRDRTLQLLSSAGPHNIVGARVRYRVMDMCPFWCNDYGDGTGHTPAPYFDTISVMVINGSPANWSVDSWWRFQDNFPEANGKVRIDSAIDVQPYSGTTLVIGDSTLIKLNMSGYGGIRGDYLSVPGQVRPSLYLHSRVVAGPNVGSTSPAMGDPDASDGIYSPRIGTAVVNGETWNVAVADTARYQGAISPHWYAFDFAEDFFMPGDIIQHYYKGIAVDNTVQTRPGSAESSNPELRNYYVVRCLPTAGATLLFVEDGRLVSGYYQGEPTADQRIAGYWQEAFRYNGYSGYDIYTTQAPSSGLHNGLGGRAEIGDIDQYEVIVWDSGDLPSFTIQNALPDDLAFDDVLLDDWLRNSAHNTCLWVMGTEVANDLDDEPSFLNVTLGATHILDGSHYNDVTGILAPQVKSVHPALSIGGQQPSFRVDAGCPFPRNLDLVEKNDALAQDAMAWSVTTGVPSARAGIYNLDPDGDGEITSPGGFTNRTLFNPFSYYQVRDEGFGVPQGYDYARRLVGDVLSSLCGFAPNGQPDGADLAPARTALAGAYPNPFNPSTAIRFALAQPERVHLEVFDLGGRRVRTLVDGPLPAAQHEAIWDGADAVGHRLPSGVYFARLVAGDYRASAKLVLLK